MRGYSTKNNQQAPKTPELKSNDLQDRNTNRNTQKESSGWLLKICKKGFGWLLNMCHVILFVFGIYLIVSFFVYSKDSFIDTECFFSHSDGASVEAQIIKTSDEFNIISFDAIENDELSLKGYRFKLFLCLCCVFVCDLACCFVIAIIEDLDE